MDLDEIERALDELCVCGHTQRRHLQEKGGWQIVVAQCTDCECKHFEFESDEQASVPAVAEE